MEPQEVPLSALFIYACGETESSEAFVGAGEKFMLLSSKYVGDQRRQSWLLHRARWPP